MEERRKAETEKYRERKSLGRKTTMEYREKEVSVNEQ
jgi:hypothetical protein